MKGVLRIHVLGHCQSSGKLVNFRQLLRTYMDGISIAGAAELVLSLSEVAIMSKGDMTSEGLREKFNKGV
jgi:hypothetical protein